MFGDFIYTCWNTSILINSTQ